MLYAAAGADFDESRTYRYLLHRSWGSGSKTALWIMLNPSTADERVLDPTLRRCQGYSIAWGFDGFEVCNLFAYRSTDPNAMWRQHQGGLDIVGPDNDLAILDSANHASRIIVGWGRHRVIQQRARDVLALLAHHELWCLGANGDGSPKHPLYLAKTAKPQRFATATDEGANG